MRDYRAPGVPQASLSRLTAVLGARCGELRHLKSAISVQATGSVRVHWASGRADQQANTRSDEDECCRPFDDGRPEHCGPRELREITEDGAPSLPHHAVSYHSTQQGTQQGYRGRGEGAQARHGLGRK